MFDLDELLSTAGPSAHGTPGGHRRRTLGAYVALLAIPCMLIALIIFFVVTSAAGAAGGCGGG
jgi:hypothetical protein